MPEPRYLVDTSVLTRAHQLAVSARLEGLLVHGRLWTCRLVDLEVAFASRASSVAAVVEERQAFPEAPITPAVMDRALRTLAELAARNLHRGAKPVDLVIAAAAEAAGLAVLHYDADFDRISSVTGQPTQWVSEPGTLD
jgi:predicted nucleic acid-binding protein